MVAASVSLESLCVNSIRMLAVDAVNKSNSGHPGLPILGTSVFFCFLDSKEPANGPLNA